MSKLARLIKHARRQPESTAAALATAATTGVTIAKFLGKKSIYGVIAGVGVGLLAKKWLDKQHDDVAAKDIIIEHEPLQVDPHAPKQP